MSGTVCYIERAERGSLPLRLRLVSPRGEAAWSFPEIAPDDRDGLVRGLQEAAGWLAEQVRERSRGRLTALVLDVDGAVCSWVSTPNVDPEAIGAMLRHATESGSEEDAAHAVGSPPHLAMDPDLRQTGGVSIQPLGMSVESGSGALAKRGQEGAPSRQRLGVLAISDASVRLLLDELDERGVDIGRTTTLWHAACGAFEVRGGGDHAERVVAEATGSTSAEVLLDPKGRRLIWAWAREGELVASGAFRLARAMGGGEEQALPPVILTRGALGRLASDWISWATQLGASPSRVRVVLTEGAWDGEASLGEAIAAIWPGATADITFDDDPVGLVLTRFAETLDDEGAGDRAGVAALQYRPTRQHRGLYRWAAIAIGAAAGAMAVGAFQVNRAAGEAREVAGERRERWRDVAGELMPSVNEGQTSFAAFDGKVLMDLRTELAKRKEEIAPVSTTDEKPVLRELETLSFVLANPEYHLERLDILPLGVFIDVVVPDTVAYEELSESLNRIGGSGVARWTRSVRTSSRPTGLRASFQGIWGDPGRATASRAGGQR